MCAMAILTQDDAKAAALAAAYEAAWYNVHGALTAIDQLLAEEFPAPGEGQPTRYQVDALRGLRASLSALVEGYERVG